MPEVVHLARIFEEDHAHRKDDDKIYGNGHVQIVDKVLGELCDGE